MTRREKVLLQICVVVGIVGVALVYLLLPLIKKNTALHTQLDEAGIQEMQMKTMVMLTGLEEQLSQEKERAAANYEFFYGKLNSYTIDDILNQKAENHHLDIQSLSISEYAEKDPTESLRYTWYTRNEDGVEIEGKVYDPKTGEVINPPEEEKVQQYLLGAQSTISVLGSYENVMNFINDLKMESDCIVVDSMNITPNTRAIHEDVSISASVSVTIYGIDNDFMNSNPEGGDE